MVNPVRGILFSLEEHPLISPLTRQLELEKGEVSLRQFPDKESYLKVQSDVQNKHCIILANLHQPDCKYLSLVFLAETLRELGATSVGLIAPYLCYMRQDRRFEQGEAVTSRIFAKEISRHVDWLLTVDPHLHRYHSLDEIYSVPSLVVSGAPALVDWLKPQNDIFLVGPDEESEQWVSKIAHESGHEYFIGKKVRHGDRDVQVQVTIPGGKSYTKAVIIDDVISSGQTILKCYDSLKVQGVNHVSCAAVHGIFADDSATLIKAYGIKELVTTNTIPCEAGTIDISTLFVLPVLELLKSQEGL